MVIQYNKYARVKVYQFLYQEPGGVVIIAGYEGTSASILLFTIVHWIWFFGASCCSNLMPNIHMRPSFAGVSSKESEKNEMRHVVGVSAMKVSNIPGDIICTHALGSCIGVAIHDQTSEVGGILHYMLPISSVDKKKAIQNPFMFGDTGIPSFFRQAYQLGANKENIRVILAGGAQIFKDTNFFDIGHRNIIIARKIFWRNNIMIASEEVGGGIPRTLYLEIGSGKTWLTSRGECIEL